MLGTAALIFTSGMSRAESPVGTNPRIVKMALPDFIAASSGVSDVARQINVTVVDDLRTSGHFVLIDPAAIEAGDIDTVPQFSGWRSLGADALVTGRVNAVDDKLQTQFRLWDVAAGWQLVSMQFMSTPDHWPDVSHAISSTIYERLVGEKRDFDSR